MKVTDPAVINLQHLHWALKACQAKAEEWGGYFATVETRLHQLVDDANLQDAGLPGRRAVPAASMYVGKLTKEQVDLIMAGFRRAFTGLAEGAVVSLSADKGNPVSFYLGTITPASRFFQSVWLHSDPVAQVAVALQQHFVRSGLTGEQVRKCPECSTIFIRERKPQKGKEQFCSPACAQRASKRAWAERQAAGYIKGEVTFVKSPARPAAAKTKKKKPRRR